MCFCLLSQTFSAKWHGTASLCMVGICQLVKFFREKQYPLSWQKPLLFAKADIVGLGAPTQLAWRLVSGGL